MLLFLSSGIIFKKRNNFIVCCKRHKQYLHAGQRGRAMKSELSSQLELECASFRLSSSMVVDSEAHFELSEYGIVGMVDCEESQVDSCQEQPPILMYMKFAIKSVLDSLIEQALSKEQVIWSQPECILSQALEQFPIANKVSSCIFKVQGDKLSYASIGTCGLIVVREDKIIYDTRPSCLQVLETAYANEELRYSSGRLGYPIRYGSVAIQQDDVVLVGNRGFLWNITSEQILAYLYPVSTSFDSTLSIANYTSLGSFRRDDPWMISYMLTHIAYHFAENGSFLSLSYPRDHRPSLYPSVSPPSSSLHHKHLVVCIACVARNSIGHLK